MHGNKFNEESQDCFNDNHKSLKIVIKEDFRIWKDLPLLVDWQNENCENDYATKSNLHVLCNLYQNSNDILH
jgi:hypothetical protein